MVFRTLSRMTGAGAHVEDLAQEVFLRLYRALPEFRGDAALTTYLFRIVVNVAQDEWKRRRREREFVAATPATEEEPASDWLENLPADTGHAHARTPEQALSDRELQAAVDAALLALPEHERAVLVLYHQEDLSYGAISAALNLPINTVRTHLHRGRKRMSELVGSRLNSPTQPSRAATAPLPRYPQTAEVTR